MSGDEEEISLEELEELDKANILPDRLRKRKNKNEKTKNQKKKKMSKRPPPDDDKQDDEEVVVLDFAELLGQILGGGAAGEKEPTPNEKYLGSLSKSKKRKILEEEKKIKKLNEIKTPLRYKVLESDLPERTKMTVMRKVEQFESAPPGSSGYYKMREYMDKILRIPFGKYKSIGVTMSDGPERISSYITNLKTNLDHCIYGQEQAKMRIMEIVAKWISNPTSKGNIIGLCGPPGVGKTTLIKNGLSKAIGLPFAFMPLGGCNNAGYLEGHDYTYEGSKNGKMLDILIENQCMNPIIFFDELDKLSETNSGREISSYLTHLTDFTQNNTIHDKYFSDIEFDFSKCLFIFSFNDKHQINPILRDRITIIEMKGFSRKEKQKIARMYSVPKYCQTVGVNTFTFDIPDSTLDYIIDNYCAEEPGIRKLEQCIEAIIMKINLYQLTGDKTYIGKHKMEGNSLIVSNEIAKTILDKYFNINEAASIMYQMMYT